MKEEKLKEERIKEEKLKEERMKEEKLKEERIKEERIKEEKLKEEKMKEEKTKEEKMKEEKMKEEKMKEEKRKQEKLKEEKLNEERMRLEKIKEKKMIEEKMRKEKEEKEERERKIRKEIEEKKERERKKKEEKEKEKKLNIKDNFKTIEINNKNDNIKNNKKIIITEQEEINLPLKIESTDIKYRFNNYQSNDINNNKYKNKEEKIINDRQSIDKEKEKEKDNRILSQRLRNKTEQKTKEKEKVKIKEKEKGKEKEKEKEYIRLKEKEKSENKEKPKDKIVYRERKREREREKEKEKEREKEREKKKENEKEREKERKKEKEKEGEREKEKEKVKEREKNREIQKHRDILSEKIEIKELNLRKEITKGKRKSNENEKTANKDKEMDIEKEQKLYEKINTRNEVQNINPKLSTNQEFNKTITPKRKINYKNIKIKPPSNLTNNTKNINIRRKTLKNLDKNNNILDKLIIPKEPVKLKTTLKSLNLNQYSNNTNQQIKGLLNSIQNYKKISMDKKDKENKENNNFYLNTDMNNNIKFDLKDSKNYKQINTISKIKKIDIFEENNKWQRLNTEIIQNKNKNYLDNRKRTNYINTSTLDTIKNSLGYISDAKKNVLINNNRNLYLNSRRDKKKYLDIKRIKSNTFTDNNNLSINNTYNSSSIKSNIIPKSSIGKKLLNKLPFLTNKSNNNDLIYGANYYNFSNRKLNNESDITDNIVKTEPSSEFFVKLNNRDNLFNHAKERVNSNLNTNVNTNINTNINSNITQSSKLQRAYPKRFNYEHPATYLRYLNNIKNPLNYNSSKANNNNNNLIKYTSNNDIVKNPSLTRDKKLIFPKNHETTITAKKNPIFNIRNTVINFNMYDTSLFINSFNKKTHDRKKFNLINPYSTQSHVQPTKKYSKETSELYSQKTYNTSINKVTNCHYRPLFKTKTISSTHNNNHSISINNTNTNNNIINSSINSNVNNKDILYSQSRPLKTQSLLEDNKINSLTSFNQLVNKMKNKQLYNKKHSNSVERNNSLFKSKKLNEYYLKSMKTKNEKKTTLELNTGGLNNMLNNKYKSINTNKNYTLPSLIVNSKKFFYPKKKNGTFMQSQGKTMRIINPLQLNNVNDNQKHYYLKGI